jgi:hypothetical protein
MLSVIMLRVVMLNVANKPFVLSVVIQQGPIYRSKKFYNTGGAM